MARVVLYRSVLGVRRGVLGGSGRLFTDPSMPEECDAGASDLLWERVLDFRAEPIGRAPVT